MSAAPSAAPAAPLTPFAAMWFAYFATIGLFNPYAPLWFKDLGFSTLAIGAIASMQAWTRVLAPYAWGWLGDRGGRRVEAIRWAAGLSLVAALGLWQWPGAAAVVLFTAALFLANGGVVPLSEAALSQHLQQGSSMDFARYGRVRVWGSLGFVLSAALFGAVLERLGIGSFPLFVVATGGLLWLAALRLPVSDGAPAAAPAGPSVWHVLRRPEVGWFFAGVFLTVLAHTALYAFLSLYLDELGHGKGVVGVAWAVAVTVEIVFFWFQGRFFARLAPLRWLQWAAGLTALRFAVLAAYGAWLQVLLATQLLHAVTFAAQHAACIALLNQHFPGTLRGRGQALYSVLGYGCSGVIGGLAGGWLGSRHGFSMVFWAASGVALLGWLALRRADALSGRAGPPAPQA
jgi:MFS transporter, PPP family, 3-phenylpropionic acid transporter